MDHACVCVCSTYLLCFCYHCRIISSTLLLFTFVCLSVCLFRLGSWWVNITKYEEKCPLSFLVFFFLRGYITTHEFHCPKMRKKNQRKKFTVEKINQNKRRN